MAKSVVNEVAEENKDTSVAEETKEKMKTMGKILGEPSR